MKGVHISFALITLLFSACEKPKDNEKESIDRKSTVVEITPAVYQYVKGTWYFCDPDGIKGRSQSTVFFNDSVLIIDNPSIPDSNAQHHMQFFYELTSTGTNNYIITRPFGDQQPVAGFDKIHFEIRNNFQEFYVSGSRYCK